MFKRLLKKAASPTTRLRKPATGLSPRPVTVAELQQLIPIRNLSEEELRAFSLSQTTETYGAGSVLFEAGTAEDSVLYLLSGTVTMVLGENQTYEVTAGSAKSRFPLSHGEHHRATAVAKTDVEVLRVSARIMHKHLSLDDDHLMQPENWDVPAWIRKTPLYQTFCQYLAAEETKLPTLPDIALRLRRAIDKDDIGIAEAARIVQLDASIATRLIQVANSPLYLAARPATNCLEAVNRLGLNATCHLVMSLCLKDLFRCRDPRLQQRMQRLWRDSLHLSALTHVLARDNRWPDPEEALLAGLICDIGAIPFLVFVSDFPKEHYAAETLEPTLNAIRGPVGHYVLKTWGFADDLAQVPLLAEAWHYDSGPDLTLADLVMLSRLHLHMEQGRRDQVPVVSTIPASQKLRDGSLSPEYSLRVLHEARAEIQAALALLR